MIRILELKNMERNEYCELDLEGSRITFKDDKKIPGYTGLYFRDSNHFFALYPTKSGPNIYYRGTEYAIHKDLTITLDKTDSLRRFKILEYNIEVEYLESPYIGMDVWSDEMDVDLFCFITQAYQTDDFYRRNTIDD